jgi:hypothetical protein
VIDSHPLLVDEELRKSSFHPDFLEDYDGAKEEIGGGFPKAYMAVNWKRLSSSMLIMLTTT